MSFFEEIYSYALTIGIPLLILAFLTLLPIRRRSVRLPLYIGVFATALVISFMLRPGNSTVDTTDEAVAIIQSGEPVFIEFFSNRCPPCIASEPNVKSLTAQVGDDVQVLKLNVEDRISLPLMQEYNAFSTPTFIVLNDLGQEVWRQTGNILDKDEALQALGFS